MPYVPELLEQAALLADPTRCRVLLALEKQELTVTELCEVLQLPQSTVSRHLKSLREGHWIRSRRDGTRRFYSSTLESLPPTQRRLWLLLREGMTSSPAVEQDQQRLEEVLVQRRRRSREYFDERAEAWDAVRSELFGDRFDLYGLLAFADPSWVFGDLGSGTGRLSAAVAPFVDRVIAVDSSRAMLGAAKQRVDGRDNVELRQGSLEQLPIDDGELDAAAVVLALHHTADPRPVLREASRALRPGGRLIVVDMQPHDRESYQSEMGHVWLGFDREYMESIFAGAGIEGFEYQSVPADLAARGPALFVARGRLPAAESDGHAHDVRTHDDQPVRGGRER